ncbi:MAG TPA: DUF4203 domain-containing protein [Vicinamibacterales bacterium]|jgi:hypothetical protein|nr:DUF4203 domain-containing protein [Vicinamibacterales bacterium]
MLPASFQTPAALVLLAGGIISCFAGYRVFRIVLGIYGFIIGALIASSAMGTEHTAWMIVGAIVGGVVGALVLIAAYFVGVALLGAGVGALAASLIWASLGREPGALVVIVFAIVGALAALALQRYVIIGATAFGGAWTIIVGALALDGHRVALDPSARNNVWLAYPTNPAPGNYWILLVWIGLGVAGVLVQLTLTAGKSRK